MKVRYNVLTYLIGEGFSNVFKNKKQAMTSIGMMCVTMLIFGIFFVIGENLNHFVGQVQSEQGIQVFMKLDSTDEQISKLKQELLSIDGVNTVDFISQAQALQQIKERFGEKAYLLEGRDESIFQVSYVVTLTDLSKSSSIQEQIKKLENVDEIKSSNETIGTLVKIAKGIRIATYVISICLVIFAIFIIANTIKLTVHARRREISIMKYVGATNSFIRWPFAVEGMIIGVIAGAISTGLLAVIYSVAVGNDGFVNFISKMGLTLLHFSDMVNLVIIVYLVLGIGIGVLGSTISMRKYLKV
ncbi:MAG: permease-like cell division protein FtsX [Clostridia bacterium]|nr:permease-like cell division protein FtsX [Clostridia bacterium]